MNTPMRVCAAWMLVAVAAVSAAERAPRLIEAVKSGNREAVRALVRQPAALAETEGDGTTALHWAVRADDREMVQLLLQAGANVNSATRHGITPLSLAAVNGSPSVTAMLLKAGAQPNAVLPEGETILMTAARTGMVEVLTLLLDHGADLNDAGKVVRRDGADVGGGRESSPRPSDYSSRAARTSTSAPHCSPSPGDALVSRSCHSEAGPP